jgi:hypothetical protein
MCGRGRVEGRETREGGGGGRGRGEGEGKEERGKVPDHESF